MSIHTETGPWAPLPKWVARAGLSDRAIRLYVELALRADSEGHDCYPGRDRLAEEMDCHPASIDRAMQELRNVGAISVRRRGRGMTNIYTVIQRDPRLSTHAESGIPDSAPMLNQESGLSTHADPESAPMLIPESAPMLRELEPVEQEPTKQEPVSVVFNAWREAAGKNGRTQLSPKRGKRIRDALKAYPLEDVVDAVRGWRHSPHHCGQNDNGTVYNDVELLLRDCEHIEKFRDLERGSGRALRVPKSWNVLKELP